MIFVVVHVNDLNAACSHSCLPAPLTSPDALNPPAAPSEPARFLRKLRDTYFRLGEPLRLECAYTGSPRVAVVWKKDGKLIWASYQYTVRTSGGACVLEVLHSDRETAAGTYTCEISNSAGADICHARVKLGNPLGTAAPPPSAQSPPFGSILADVILWFHLKTVNLVFFKTTATLRV